MSSSTRTHWFIRGCALAAFLAFLAHVVQSLLLWSEEPTVNPVLLLLGMLGALAGIAALYSVQRDSEDYWMVQVVASLAAFVGVAFVLVSAVILDLVGPGVQWETSLQQLLGLFTFLFLPI